MLRFHAITSNTEIRKSDEDIAGRNEIRLQWPSASSVAMEKLIV